MNTIHLHCLLQWCVKSEYLNLLFILPPSAPLRADVMSKRLGCCTAEQKYQVPHHRRVVLAYSM